jgi:hypothetical protein
MLQRWRPTTWHERDLQALEPLLPTIRGWVRQIEARDATQAAQFLRAASGIAVWAHRTLGNIDATVVFHPSNVEEWTMKTCADRSMRWREITRSRLRSLGRVVNAEGWPPPTQKVGKQTVARPYTRIEERAFRLAGGLPGRVNRVHRLWVVCGSLGAGLRGMEIRAARVSDLEQLAGDRLAIRVRGPNSRLVPIRKDYTGLATAAADASTIDRFIPTNGRNIISATAARLNPSLSLRRARSTWLAAHMAANTPLAVLRQVAGPLSLNTLDGLLDHTVTSMKEETAVLGALGA